MANYYYSGQGSLMIAHRHPTNGQPLGFVRVGNVPELTFTIDVTKQEHQESESGNSVTDLSRITAKKGTFEFKLENLALDNLALGFWGESATAAAGTVNNEVLYVPKTAVAGMRFSFSKPGASAHVVTNVAGTTTYAAPTDYVVDPQHGDITLPSGSAILAAANALPGADDILSIHVDYSHRAFSRMQALTQVEPPVRYLRFAGINTIDGSLVSVDLFKAQLDPLSGYALIGTDVASVTLKGDLLADPLQSTGSQFFRQTNYADS